MTIERVEGGRGGATRGRGEQEGDEGWERGPLGDAMEGELESAVQACGRGAALRFESLLPQSLAPYCFRWQ